MHVITDENLEKLEGYKSFTFTHSMGMDDSTPATDEQLYNLGAHHAFISSMDLIDEVEDKAELNATPIVLALVAGGSLLAYVNRDKIKKLAKKFNKKLRRS